MPVPTHSGLRACVRACVDSGLHYRLSVCSWECVLGLAPVLLGPTPTLEQVFVGDEVLGEDLCSSRSLSQQRLCCEPWDLWANALSYDSSTLV